MEKLSISEYAQKFNLTREAVFYQIKKGQLKAEQDKKTKKWTIFLKEQKEEKPTQTDETENLKLELAELRAELRVKNEFIEKIEDKNQEIINSKSETIESQKKTIQALEITYTQLEIKYQNQNKLLTQQQTQPKEEKIIIESQVKPQEKEQKSEKHPITPKTQTTPSPISPKTENSKIELMEFLQNQGITDQKKKQAIRARFNRRIGKDKTISKNKKGKIYLDKNQNYNKILNP